LPPFIPDLPADYLANVGGDGSCVHVQVLTSAAALIRGKQLGVVGQLTTVIAAGRWERGCRAQALAVRLNKMVARVKATTTMPPNSVSVSQR
jgi:hypothetical protein